MKQILGTISALLLTALLLPTAHAGVSGKNFEFYGYMRTGTGMGSQGGQQICFNSDAGAEVMNQLRLGNECDFLYGELGFSSYLLRGEANDPYFKSNILLAFHSPERQVWESQHSGTGSGFDPKMNDITPAEAYIEAGNLEGLPMKLWVGKRYYRFQDVHMYDWYYWGSLGGGVGAGLSDIKLGSGQFSAALLTGSSDMAKVSNIWTSTENKTTYSTNKGTPQTRVLDFKYENIPLAEKSTLNFWMALASSPAVTLTTTPDTGAASTAEMEAGNGLVVGVRHHQDLAAGFNDFSIIRGSGILSKFSIYWPNTIEHLAANNTWNKASTLRFVEHLTTEIGTSWAMHGVLAYDQFDSGANTNPKTTWASVGVRPVWFITNNFHLAFEAGAANAKADGAASHQLIRYTIAPELTVAKSIWARPVLRAYYTQSSWNDANKGNVGGAAYADKTSGSAFGFQGEVWF